MKTLLKQSVKEESVNPYTTPVVAVKKKMAVSGSVLMEDD